MPKPCNSGKMIIWYFSFGLFINLNDTLWIRCLAGPNLFYIIYMYLRNQSQSNPKQGCILWGFPSWLKSWAWTLDFDKGHFRIPHFDSRPFCEQSLQGLHPQSMIRAKHVVSIHWFALVCLGLLQHAFHRCKTLQKKGHKVKNKILVYAVYVGDCTMQFYGGYTVILFEFCSGQSCWRVCTKSCKHALCVKWFAICRRSFKAVTVKCWSDWVRWILQNISKYRIIPRGFRIPAVHVGDGTPWVMWVFPTCHGYTSCNLLSGRRGQILAEICSFFVAGMKNYLLIYKVWAAFRYNLGYNSYN